MLGFGDFAWLSQDRLYWALIPIYVWLMVGFNLVLYLAAMEGIDPQYYEAAELDGAGPVAQFFRVTLPNVKWAVLYGVILCNARAMGEFGAVSVVSGHIRGKTNTLPLHVEILYNEYNFVAAFAIASLLALLAMVTLAIKSIIEWRSRTALHAPVRTDLT